MTSLSIRTIRAGGGGTEGIRRVKIGRQWLYVEADVRKWIETQIDQAKPARQPVVADNVRPFRPQVITNDEITELRRARK